MLIGLTGRARAGKSEAAKVLLEEYGFVELSFAAPIRKFVADLLQVSLVELELIKEIPHKLLDDKTPRYAMQTLGTEWGRQMIDDQLWVKSCWHKAKGNINIVISDVRFDNEALAILAEGGIIVRIERPDGQKIQSSTHASEAGVLGWYVTNTIINKFETLKEYREHLQTEFALFGLKEI